jgi:regulator of chromosome condensation
VLPQSRSYVYLLIHHKSADGILGFTEDIHIQTTPILIPGLKNIKALAAGSNHVLALDDRGGVAAWGSGQQNQLGRRVIERNRMSSLVPQGLGFPRKNKITKIACGSYHSFALDTLGNVWGWGLNNFGETGIVKGAGEEGAAVLKPTIIESLEDFDITDIAGGEHHSIACDRDGKLIAWGRVDGHQVGVPLSKLDLDNAIFDDRGTPRILVVPTVLPGTLMRCIFDR